MELKFGRTLPEDAHVRLLIVPYGIEITFRL